MVEGCVGQNCSIQGNQANNAEEQEGARGMFTTPKATLVHFFSSASPPAVCHLPMAPSNQESIKSSIHSFFVRTLCDLISYGALSPSPRPFSIQSQVKSQDGLSQMDHQLCRVREATTIGKAVNAAC